MTNNERCGVCHLLWCWLCDIVAWGTVDVPHHHHAVVMPIICCRGGCTALWHVRRAPLMCHIATVPSLCRSFERCGVSLFIVRCVSSRLSFGHSLFVIRLFAVGSVVLKMRNGGGSVIIVCLWTCNVVPH
jgi:hypothetical protein